MGWTLNFFAYKASQWKKWAADVRHPDLSLPGHECYALRQEAFWLSMEHNARLAFEEAVAQLVPGPPKILGLRKFTYSDADVEMQETELAALSIHGDESEEDDFWGGAGIDHPAGSSRCG